MTIRLEIDIAFNCRPKKGERRAPDRSGRMMKTTISFGRSLDDVLYEARAARAAGEKLAPGYSEVIAVRAYPNDTFNDDPLGTAPTFTAASL